MAGYRVRLTKVLNSNFINGIADPTYEPATLTPGTVGDFLYISSLSFPAMGYRITQVMLVNTNGNDVEFDEGLKAATATRTGPASNKYNLSERGISWQFITRKSETAGAGGGGGYTQERKSKKSRKNKSRKCRKSRKQRRA